jgi:hypothetical protein
VRQRVVPNSRDELLSGFLRTKSSTDQEFHSGEHIP